MRKSLLAFALSSFFFVDAQIEYPGSATTLGSASIIFDYSTANCNQLDIPDAPARAFRDASGKINLIATHYKNWRMTGSDFTSLTKDCNMIMDSHQSSNPSDFNNNEWIMSTYTEDGVNIHALVHNEYVPCGNWNNCWYNSITYASSSDSGKTYTHPTAPNHLVASSPYVSPYPTTHSPFGIFGGSNIIKKGGYYYKLVQVEAHGVQDWGVGVLRTNNLSDPASWRGWDGSGFNVVMANPYTTANMVEANHVLTPVSRDNIGKMCANVTYNTYLQKYVVVDFASGSVNGSSVSGFFFSTSTDLIHWTKKQLIMQTQSTWSVGGSYYPSLIDHADTSRNFEYTGQTPYLYYTKWNSGTYDRDLLRIQIQFTKKTVSGFVVTTTGNQSDATPGDGVCKIVGSSACTLRAALEESNARPDYLGYDTISLPITFAITGTGIKTISPSTYLPEIFYPIDLNGYTQTGASANTNNFNQGLNTAITVVLNAGNTGGAPALQFHSARNRVRGLAIKDGDIYFGYEPGYSKGEGKNSVEGCFLGIAPDGVTAYSGGGITITGTGGITVGGTTNAARNLIVGTVYMFKADSNYVVGNYIGSDKTGSAAGGAGNFGVDMQDSCIYNTIGGTNSSERNLISGTTSVGVSISGAHTHHNKILNNYIGVAVDGTSDLGNGRAGINISGDAYSNIIGQPSAGNVICNNSNDEAGIWMDGTYNNTVQSNYIGTDAGMTVQGGNGNVGQFSAGIMILGNSHDNTIGGWNANEGNVIANNLGYGISVYNNAGNGNAFASNTFYNNAEMAIDLSADLAVNGNDNKDSDTGGPNELQNFPDLSVAETDGSTIEILGNLNSVPNGSYKIQFYYNAACDGVGNGEGEVYIGTSTLNTNGSGDAPFDVTFSKAISVGAVVTAIATDANNNSSEFSACVQVDQATSVDKLIINSFKVYPTNVDDVFFIEGNGTYSYTVYDMDGKKVLTSNSSTSKTAVDVSALEQGMYLIQIQNDKGIEQKTIVK